MSQSPLPRYQQIKQFILGRIERGDWPVSHQVPSENKLCEQFAVSRMTARKALQELTAEGVLVRAQGLGSFVAEPKPQSSMLEVRNIADEVKARGHGYSNQVLILNPVQATDAVAIALELQEQTEVFHSVIVHYENDQPLQYEERFINPRFAPDYLQQNFSRITPNVYLNQVAAMTEATHVVEAMLPDESIADALAMSPANPCLQITRRSWCRNGVVSLAKLIHPGDRFRLGGHLNVS